MGDPLPSRTLHALHVKQGGSYPSCQARWITRVMACQTRRCVHVTWRAHIVAMRPAQEGVTAAPGLRVCRSVPHDGLPWFKKKNLGAIVMGDLLLLGCFLPPLRVFKRRSRPRSNRSPIPKAQSFVFLNQGNPCKMNCQKDRPGTAQGG